MKNPNEAFRARLLLSCVLALLAVALLRAETWYLIPEPELTRLEQISTQYPTDRQISLSLVSKLQGQVKTLKTDSANLNGQLSAERILTQTLKKSFEQSAIENTSKLKAKQTEITDLTKDVSDRDIKIQKKDKWIIILSGILGVIALGIAGLVFLKIKGLFNIFKAG